MADVRCRPIDHWNGPYTYVMARRRAPFKVGWATMTKDLDREFEYLDARDVTLGIDVRADQIRLDGWPRAGVTVPPPVSLTMATRVGALRFQCDRWDMWRGNLRAIGLTLHRLRLVDEGGCTRSGEQYQGWGALPPAREAGATQMTADEAAQFIAGWADTSDANLQRVAAEVLERPGVRGTLYRQAAARLHPDAGGDPALFRRLTEARDLLEAPGGR